MMWYVCFVTSQLCICKLSLCNTGNTRYVVSVAKTLGLGWNVSCAVAGAVVRLLDWNARDWNDSSNLFDARALNRAWFV